MELQIQDLVSSIRKDGIESANKESAAIISEAKKQAAAILAEAESEAKKTRESAQQEIEVYRNSARLDAQQANWHSARKSKRKWKKSSLQTYTRPWTPRQWPS